MMSVILISVYFGRDLLVLKELGLLCENARKGPHGRRQRMPGKEQPYPADLRTTYIFSGDLMREPTGCRCECLVNKLSGVKSVMLRLA